MVLNHFFGCLLIVTKAVLSPREAAILWLLGGAGLHVSALATVPMKLRLINIVK
jgi:hypothetical protein